MVQGCINLMATQKAEGLALDPPFIIPIHFYCVENNSEANYVCLSVFTSYFTAFNFMELDTRMCFHPRTNAVEDDWDRSNSSTACHKVFNGGPWPATVFILACFYYRKINDAFTSHKRGSVQPEYDF